MIELVELNAIISHRRLRALYDEHGKDLLQTLAFLLLFLVQLTHHQLWRDELNAYGIAAASPDLRTLLHYIHYDGHPWPWYVLLWCVSRVHAAPAIGLKLVTGSDDPGENFYVYKVSSASA